MHSLLQESREETPQGFIDQVIQRNADRPGALLSILEAVQDKNPHKYLPMETLKYIAERADIPLARIYSVATFYSLFNLQPQGKNTVYVCRGTACHTRGSRNLLHSLRLELGLGADEPQPGESESAVATTADRLFTVRTVACFGQCALAPVVEVNHRICGHVNERTLQREVKAVAPERK